MSRVSNMIALLCCVIALAGVPAWGDAAEATAFDQSVERARQAILGDKDLWMAPPDAEQPTGEAEKVLESLLSQHMPRMVEPKENPKRRVLFVQSGQTTGRRWLAFACISTTGLTVHTFETDPAPAPGSESNGAMYDQLFETRAFWRVKTLELNVIKVERDGEFIRTTVMINGGRNEVLWSLTPSKDPEKTPVWGGASKLVICAVRPQTGWTDDSNWWWPDTQSWRLFDCAGPDKEFPSINKATAVAFVPDGRIALASATQVGLLPVDGSPIKTHSLEKITTAINNRLREPDFYLFSADGLALLVSEREGAWMVDTVEGRVKRLFGSIAGKPKAAFSSNRSLVFADNSTANRVDLDTLKTTPINLGWRTSLGAAGEFISAPTRGDKEIELIDLRSREVVRKFDTGPTARQPSLSPDGRWLMLKGAGLRLYDANTGQLVWDHAINSDVDNPRAAIKWTADGSRGAVAGNGHVYLWNTTEPRWVARFPYGKVQGWKDVALSPDGKRLVACGESSESLAYWPDVDAAVKAGLTLKSQPVLPKPRAVPGMAVTSILVQQEKKAPERTADEHAKAVRACMEYKAPAQRVVWTQNYSEGRRLLESDKGYVEQGGDARGVSLKVAELDALRPSTERGDLPFSFWFGPVLFMHGRKTPSGREVLVLLHWSSREGLLATLMDPATVTTRQPKGQRVQLLTRGQVLGINDEKPGLDVPQRLRFFAGQPDPSDPSKWSIRYTESGRYALKGTEGVIELQLTDDADLKVFRLTPEFTKESKAVTIVKFDRPSGPPAPPDP